VTTEFYVAVNGADGSPCTITQPCRSLTYATNYAIDNGPPRPRKTIHLGPGIWNETVWIGSHQGQLVYSGAGSGQTVWNGDANSAGVLIANTGTDIGLRALTGLATNNKYQSFLYAQSAGQIQILDGVVFGTATAAHMQGESLSRIFAWNDYKITGSALSHISVIASTHVGLGAIVITFENGPSFDYFLSVDVLSSVVLGGTTFSGAVNMGVTKRYTVNNNSIINTFGRGPGLIPGYGGSASNGAFCQ
jgi:hypothetical protein